MRLSDVIEGGRAEGWTSPCYTAQLAVIPQPRVKTGSKKGKEKAESVHSSRWGNSVSVIEPATCKTLCCEAQVSFHYRTIEDRATIEKTVGTIKGWEGAHGVGVQFLQQGECQSSSSPH